MGTNVSKSIHGDHGKILVYKHVKVSYPSVGSSLLKWWSVKETGGLTLWNLAKTLMVALKLSQNKIGISLFPSDTMDLYLQSYTEISPLLKLEKLIDEVHVIQDGLLLALVGSKLEPISGGNSTRHIFFTCQIARDILHLITSWWCILVYGKFLLMKEWLI
ncbi:hypothetical protein Tco_1183471 [Tanacetum coccineum]